MDKCKFPLLVYSHNPLASRYLHGLLSTKENSVLALNQSIPEAVRSVQSGFILVADEGPHEFSKQELLRLLKHCCRKARILVIGNSTSTVHLHRLVLIGVHGFVQYNNLESELLLALEVIQEGRLWMPVEAVTELGHQTNSNGSFELSWRYGLTPQEEVILKFLGQNLSNKEIGTQLRITERTVKFHISNIFTKLGVRDRHSVVHFVNSAIPDPSTFEDDCVPPFTHKGTSLSQVTRRRDNTARSIQTNSVLTLKDRASFR